ncbi:DUF397 domain-containing protein [Streptomyces lacrimifluminis]|uniref:DUF397 domain-containing protein n=1 Tax=Streptomyces lacrimifluminis TaxID=1500077 RepID=A0A917KFE2_9ACTN|nr:DUF397 domain-containing protein [Streptomyces lacrimifluminis]GGJ11226.1 DUF397 domain-containing protein [Streptomyces lacrimifluminis]
MSTSELRWFKSTYSDTSEPGDCVEVATTPHAIHIRDSKSPTPTSTPHLTLAPTTWNSFVTHLSAS